MALALALLTLPSIAPGRRAPMSPVAHLGSTVAEPPSAPPPGHPRDHLPRRSPRPPGLFPHQSARRPFGLAVCLLRSRRPERSCRGLTSERNAPRDGWQTRPTAGVWVVHPDFVFA